MSKYYDSFLSVNQSPFDEFHSFEQALVNEEFEASPTWYSDIEQETEFGSLEFVKIDARINQIMDSKVGDRINDDYRKIIFRDLGFKPELGSRYRFDNNIWIVYSTDNIKSTHSSCYIRRCNNTINLQDKYGNIHQEPCVIDIKPTKSGITEQEYMSTPIARQVLMYQVNKWTQPLFINSRVMFNRQVYKIGAIMELNRTETFDENSIKLVKCYVDNDLVNEYDNEILQVADYKHYAYSIKSVTEIVGKVGETGALKATVTLDDEELPEPVYWYSSNTDIITVDKETGDYAIQNTGTAKIYAKMVNNESFYTEIPVQIVDSDIQNYKNIISPFIEYIPLGTQQEYEVYETLNGQKTQTKFDITVSGMSNKYYVFTQTGNKFTILNKLPNDNNLLHIVATNLRDNSQVHIDIELGGLF